jgi:hypothetical protein
VESLVWVELMFPPIWSRSSSKWTSGFRISAALSHGEELEMATSSCIGKRSTTPLTTTFLYQSQESIPVCLGLAVEHYRNETTAFPCTFKKMYGDKAADQPSGRYFAIGQ